MTSNPSYRIFGRIVRLDGDRSVAGRILEEELSRYARAPDDAEPDLIVRLHPPGPSSGRLINPAVHEEHAGGFLARYRMADVEFHLNGSALTGVDFFPTRSDAALLRHARRWLDMQFTTREERAGVIFHEMVMIPSVYFDHGLALVHASAFEDPMGGVTLVGGTGGVGKTSLEIELCLHHGFRFLADDVTVVGRDGHVWPNLAFPKIYAYNLEDNPELAARVLGRRGWPDRLHWHGHRRRGPAHVRRRVAPEVLYGGFSREGGPLRRYVILVREDRPALEVSELPPATAAEMSVAVMETEYREFNNHLHWHAFNRLAAGREPVLRGRDVLDRWREHLTLVFGGASCRLARVPLRMAHGDFKRQMADVLKR
jgi:hypothetical protein